MSEPHYMVFGTIVRRYMSRMLAHRELHGQGSDLDEFISDPSWVPVNDDRAARLTAEEAVAVCAAHTARFPGSHVEVILAED